MVSEEITCSYQLTSLMNEEAISLMTPGGSRNPAYIASSISIALLLAYCLLLQDTGNTVLEVVWAFICFALLLAGSRWRDIMTKRLQRSKVLAAQLDKSSRKVELSITPTRLSLSQAGESQTYGPGDIKSVKASSRLLLVAAKSGQLILIPAKALSASRFQAVKEYAEALTHKRTN